MDNFVFSKRTDWELSVNRLNEELELLRSQKAALIDLTESNPTRCGFHYPEELLDALKNSGSLTYAPDSKGLFTARQEIARQHADIDPESIVLTSSTSEAYAFLLRLLVNPGERVLIGRPSYPLFQYLIELADAQYDFYPMVFEGRWRIDFDALEEIVDPTTRVLILVNPNNPTGSYISREELTKLNQFCRKHHLAIISDEVFFDYPLDQNHPGVSLLNNEDVLTFVLGGLSKSLALPQMKLSWILTSGPQNQVKEALNRLEIIADTFLSVNTPVQNAVGPWFNHKNQIQGPIIERVRRNYQAVRQFAQNESIECLPSEGGWYAVLKMPMTLSEEDWTLGLLQNQHVFVHPGYFFDFKDEGCIVISLLPAEDQMKAGLKKIGEWMRA